MIKRFNLFTSNYYDVGKIVYLTENLEFNCSITSLYNVLDVFNKALWFVVYFMTLGKMFLSFQIKTKFILIFYLHIIPLLASTGPLGKESHVFLQIYAWLAVRALLQLQRDSTL